MLVSGAVYSFPLPNGLHSACRIIRLASDNPDDQSRFPGHILLSNTSWFGQPPPTLKDPGIKKLLKTKKRDNFIWLPLPLPDEFSYMGLIKTPAAELAIKCNCRTEWDSIRNGAYWHWRNQNEPEAFAAECEATKQAAIQAQQAALAQALQNERIDLDGFVPLPKPKTEREPVEVLQGFIAAMNQWEKESARVSDAVPNFVFKLNKEPQQLVFDEFCTPKERKHGRLGSFTRPPEYDLQKERVLNVRKVSQQRVEITTERQDEILYTFVYVLLKQDGMWLIDNKKCNGRNSIL